MKTFARSGDNSFTFGVTSDCSVMGGGHFRERCDNDYTSKTIVVLCELAMKFYTSSFYDFVNDNC